jgi:hypothetical protein
MNNINIDDNNIDNNNNNNKLINGILKHNRDILKIISENIGDFSCSKYIKIYEEPPSSFEFLRDVVSLHQPCIIKGLMNDWKAMEKWNEDLSYFNNIFGDKDVEINITPDGHGDAVLFKDINSNTYNRHVDNITNDHLFIYPAEVNMKIKQFINMMINPKDTDAVCYLSQQDDNLRKHYPELIDDIGINLSIFLSKFIL